MENIHKALLLISLTSISIISNSCVDKQEKEEYERKLNAFYDAYDSLKVNYNIDYNSIDWDRETEWEFYDSNGDSLSFYKFERDENVNPSKIIIPERNIPENKFKIDTYYNYFLRIDWSSFPEKTYWHSKPILRYNTDHNDIVNIVSPEGPEYKPITTVLGDKMVWNATIILGIKTSNDQPHIIDISLDELKVYYAKKLKWRKDPYGKLFEYQLEHIVPINFRLILNTPDFNYSHYYLRVSRGLFYLFLWVLFALISVYVEIIVWEHFEDFREWKIAESKLSIWNSICFFIFGVIFLFGIPSILFNDISFFSHLSNLVLRFEWYYIILIMMTPYVLFHLLTTIPMLVIYFSLTALFKK